MKAGVLQKMHFAVNVLSFIDALQKPNLTTRCNVVAAILFCARWQKDKLILKLLQTSDLGKPFALTNFRL